MINWRHEIWTVLGCLALLGCGADPQGFGGQCALNCANATIGSSDFKIEVKSSAAKIQCAGTFTETKKLDGPIAVQFLVYKDDPAPGQGGKTVRVPVPNVSIEPLVTGLMDYEATESDLKEGSSSSAFRYSGIVTKGSDWCSDSCGVVTLEVQPLCVSGATNSVNVQVHSGALYSDSAKIEVSHDDNG